MLLIYINMYKRKKSSIQIRVVFFYQWKVVFKKFQEKDKKTIIAIQDTKLEEKKNKGR